jgi:hypothetical protein
MKAETMAILTTKAKVRQKALWTVAHLCIGVQAYYVHKYMCGVNCAVIGRCELAT